MPESDLLYRQVPRGEISTEGNPQSQTFLPTKKDQDNLSMYDGSQLSPEESYQHYTEVLKLQSAGVVGISCAEAEALGIRIQPDPQPDFPSHTLLDFSNLTTNSKKREAARELKNKAIERGWLYRPPTP